MAEQRPKRPEDPTVTSHGNTPAARNVSGSAAPSGAGAASGGASGGGLKPGQKFGKYQVIRLLGEGGMGAVYEAVDTVLQRKVAIKALPERFAANEDAMKRFLREARAAAQLNHPNAVMVYEVARRENTAYIAMELVVGATAQDVIDQHGAMAPSVATRIISDACRAVAAAHQVGLIHRDIKPTNLLVAKDGSCKLSDFGLAKSLDRDLNITRDNSLLGTPRYMSPEQARGKPADHRADIYSLGGTYHALLTGRPPYERNSAVELLYAHCHEPPPDPRKLVPSLSGAHARVVMRAMAKAPEERYATADAMLADLEAIAKGNSGGAPGTGGGGATAESAEAGNAFHEVLNQIEAASPTVMSTSQLPKLPTMATRVKTPQRTGLVVGLSVGGGVLAVALALTLGWWLTRGSSEATVTDGTGTSVSTPGKTASGAGASGVSSGVVALSSPPLSPSSSSSSSSTPSPLESAPMTSLPAAGGSTVTPPAASPPSTVPPAPAPAPGTGTGTGVAHGIGDASASGAPAAAPPAMVSASGTDSSGLPPAQTQPAGSMAMPLDTGGSVGGLPAPASGGGPGGPVTPGPGPGELPAGGPPGGAPGSPREAGIVYSEAEMKDPVVKDWMELRSTAVGLRGSSDVNKVRSTFEQIQQVSLRHRDSKNELHRRVADEASRMFTHHTDMVRQREAQMGERRDGPPPGGPRERPPAGQRPGGGQRPPR